VQREEAKSVIRKQRAEAASGGRREEVGTSQPLSKFISSEDLKTAGNTMQKT
jgi:hypothetical protein